MKPLIPYVAAIFLSACFFQDSPPPIPAQPVFPQDQQSKGDAKGLLLVRYTPPMVDWSIIDQQNRNDGFLDDLPANIFARNTALIEELIAPPTEARKHHKEPVEPGEPAKVPKASPQAPSKSEPIPVGEHPGKSMPKPTPEPTPEPQTIPEPPPVVRYEKKDSSGFLWYHTDRVHLESWVATRNAQLAKSPVLVTTTSTVCANGQCSTATTTQYVKPRFRLFKRQ